jgi:hypothetical protein
VVEQAQRTVSIGRSKIRIAGPESVRVQILYVSPLPNGRDACHILETNRDHTWPSGRFWPQVINRVPCAPCRLLSKPLRKSRTGARNLAAVPWLKISFARLRQQTDFVTTCVAKQNIQGLRRWRGILRVFERVYFCFVRYGCRSFRLNERQYSRSTDDTIELVACVFHANRHSMQ